MVLRLLFVIAWTNTYFFFEFLKNNFISSCPDVRITNQDVVDGLDVGQPKCLNCR